MGVENGMDGQIDLWMSMYMVEWQYEYMNKAKHKIKVPRRTGSGSTGMDNWMDVHTMDGHMHV